MPSAPARARLDRLLALVAVVVASFVFFFFWTRPWTLRWGATDEELSRPLPGDAIVAIPERQETRAMTIDAPVEAVWPWVAQLARGEGPARAYVAGRAVAFGAPDDASWACAIEPVDDRTRLIARSRWGPDRSVAAAALDRLVLQPVRAVRERWTMTRLKARADGGGPTPVTDAIVIASWGAVAIACLGFAVLALLRAVNAPPLFAMGAAALTFQVLTFLQPAPAVAVGAAVALGWLLVAMARAGSPRDRGVLQPVPEDLEHLVQ